MQHMKKYLIFLVPATLLTIALVPTLPAFASNSDDEDSDDEGSGNAGPGVSCSPITGNPYQEKCRPPGDEIGKVLPGGEGCTVQAPEDTATHTPSPKIRVPC